MVKQASQGGSIADLLDLDFGAPAPAVIGSVSSSPVAPAAKQAKSGGNDLLNLMDDDFGGLGGGAGVPPQSSSPLAGYGFTSSSPTSSPFSTGFSFPKQQVLAAATSSGLDLSVSAARRNGKPCLEMTFSNKSAAPMNDFAIQFNVNT